MKKSYLVLVMVLTLSLLTMACASKSSNENASGSGTSQNVTVKIGIQGSGGLFGKAREEKWFEQEFEKTGAKVEWIEFQSGPPMTEAIASNKLDIASLGNMPIIAAQAANIPFKIVSQVLDGKNNVAIIVPAGSTAQSLSDLKGKKIAVTKGSNAYNFLYRGLEKSGLTDKDFEIIQLQPDETQSAFETGSVDAWATWDPYITLNTLTGKGKVLSDGEQLGVLSPSFTIAGTGFAEEHPELVTLYLKVVNKALKWESEHETEAIDRYAAERSVPASVISGTFERSRMINTPVNENIVEEMQQTADFQYKVKNIRNQVVVKAITDNQYIDAALKDPLK
ncbi:aliphatic sulfonate ABC transporter substrate-binding protein [Paenibacillus taichungensis]|uniref:Aliphatic sulfonate ABC transporter substrate-binding protein n=1 Tax=Paenibacillus taichungensis TaxID=484184 RepID=A0ABX2MRD9_9BACL|nr:aliphatic sulfonate ABC transporter substrate-binding protein [Paenibacillus taichungensis]NUU56633.1 aliphatic sulfonate ABC transporter substrate-binding protein [Paenibacillus taichungensis]